MIKLKATYVLRCRFTMPLKGYEGEASTGRHWSTLSHSPLRAACRKRNAATSHLLHPSLPSRPGEESSFPRWANGACDGTEEVQLFWGLCAADGASISSSASSAFSWRTIPQSLSSSLHREARAYSPAPARVWAAHPSYSELPSRLKSLKTSRRCSMAKTLCESHTKEFVRQYLLLSFSCGLSLSGTGWCPSQESLELWHMKQQAAMSTCCFLPSPCPVLPQKRKKSSNF